MRYIKLSQARTGDVVAQDIKDNSGNYMIRKGTKIKTKATIRRLENLGVQEICIEDSWSADIFLETVVDEELAKRTMDALSRLDIEQVHKAAAQIVDKLATSEKIYEDMQALKRYDEVTFEHSLSVAILAATLGIGIGLSYERLKNLTSGALLHDIGKQAIPLSILNKPGPLSKDEREVVKTHPDAGYELLKDEVEITSSVRGIVHEHHENWNGTGYPFGYKEQEIYDLAHIVHICDVWNALVSKRPYKDAFPIQKTVFIINQGRGTEFDDRLVNAFFRYVPIYQKGDEVTLSDHSKALIYEQNRMDMLHPQVILKDKTIIDLRESDLEIIS